MEYCCCIPDFMMGLMLESLRLVAVRTNSTAIPSMERDNQEMFRDPKLILEALRLVGTEGGPLQQ